MNVDPNIKYNQKMNIYFRQNHKKIYSILIEPIEPYR